MRLILKHLSTRHRTKILVLSALPGSDQPILADRTVRIKAAKNRSPSKPHPGVYYYVVQAIHSLFERMKPSPTPAADTGREYGLAENDGATVNLANCIDDLQSANNMQADALTASCLLKKWVLAQS